MKKISLATCLLVFAKLTYGQYLEGAFYDPRDGQEYETVLLQLKQEGGVIIEREWFSSNLNYEMDGSFCYKNYREYCGVYGRLYSWDAAMEACPTGWHLTTDEEWQQLADHFGGTKSAASAMKEGGESGLNVIMAGFGEQNETYIDVGVNAYFWNISDVNSTTPGLITFHNGEDYISNNSINATHRNSVRCVRDYDLQP